MDYKIEHRKQEGEGEFVVIKNDVKSGNLYYTLDQENKMRILHTEVDQTLKGSGAAVKLLDHAAEFARSKNYKIVAVCSFAKIYMADRHPEKYKDVLA